MNLSLFKYCFSLMLPTALTYFPLGIVFGVLFTHADYQWYLAPVMSATIYSATAQFIALGSMQAHASLWATLFATLFIALRNSFYGLSLIKRYESISFWKKIFLIFGLVDASYAVLTKHKVHEHDAVFCFYITLIPYLAWVGGTLIGAVFADVIPELPGLKFILTGFFFVLALEYFLESRKIDAIYIPLLTSLVAFILLPQYYLLLAIILCGVYLYFTTEDEC